MMRTGNWTDVSNIETGFRVERILLDGEWGAIASLGADTATYDDATVSFSTTYLYRVIAEGELSDSSPSNEVSVSTPDDKRGSTEGGT